MTRRWPSEGNPHSGTWVRDQVAALEQIGFPCDVLWDAAGSGIVPYLRLRRAMMAALADKEYELVHAHYGFTGIVAASQRSAPVVVTFHGTDVLGRPYARFHRRLFGAVETRLSRLLARHIDSAIVVSPYIGDALRAKHSHVVPMGIDPTRFALVPRADARSRLGLDPDTRLAIFVGDPQLRVKRFALAANAVENVNNLIGRTELIAVHGRTHEEVALFMNAADVLLLTSYSEGSPTVVKEALACNLPVVSVDVGDVRDQLAGVEPSRVCEADERALAHALAEILRSPVRSNGRETIDRFTNETAARSVSRIYHEVVDGL